MRKSLLERAGVVVMAFLLAIGNPISVLADDSTTISAKLAIGDEYIDVDSSLISFDGYEGIINLPLDEDGCTTYDGVKYKINDVSTEVTPLQEIPSGREMREVVCQLDDYTDPANSYYCFYLYYYDTQLYWDTVTEAYQINVVFDLEEVVETTENIENTTSVSMNIVTGGTSVPCDTSNATVSDGALTLDLSDLGLEYVDDKGCYKYNDNLYYLEPEVSISTQDTLPSDVKVKHGLDYDEFYDPYEFNVSWYLENTTMGGVYEDNVSRNFDVSIKLNLIEANFSLTTVVDIEDEVWDYLGYGTWKNLKMQVGDTVYNLSKDTPTEVTFIDGASVKVFTGESYDLWVGKVSVKGVSDTLTYGSMSFNGKYVVAHHVIGLYYSDETGVMTIKKEASKGFGGGDSGVGDQVKFNYDLKVQDENGSPIEGISIIDESDDSFITDFAYQLESGKTYTWGTANSFRVVLDEDYNVEDATLTCVTDENGYADMIFPLNMFMSEEDAAYWKEQFGTNSLFNLSIGYTYNTIRNNPFSSSNMYVNDGLVDINADKNNTRFPYLARLDSFGITPSLVPFTGVVEGSYYEMVNMEYDAGQVTLRDSFGNEIGTVTMTIDSLSTYLNVTEDWGIVGSGSTREGSITPVVTIDMAEGVSDWKVSVSYEDYGAEWLKGTFHITATKTNKSDISVYDVYGASVEDGLVSTSNATVVPRYELNYIEPSSSISIENKGVQTIDGVEYTPIVGDDLTVTTRARAISNRVDVVQSDSVDVDIEADNSYSVYFYYSAPAEEVPETYTLKVIDVYGDDEVERETKTVLAGYEYSYKAIEKDDWKVKGKDSYSGTITQDTTIYFYYEKEVVIIEQVTIKVFDHFGTNVETRINMTVDKGTPYNYDALVREGWNVVGEINYNGVVNTDTEIHFYYEEPSEEVKQVTIKVIDVFNISEKSANVQSTATGDTYTNKDYTCVGKATVDYSTRGVITPNTKTVERDNFTVNSGYAYNFKALSSEDWLVLDSSTQSGVATEDIEIYFYYEQLDIDNPSPVIPNEPLIPDVTPEQPVQPSEPKTGDATSPFGLFAIVSALTFMVAKKKRK